MKTITYKVVATFRLYELGNVPFARCFDKLEDAEVLARRINKTLNIKDKINISDSGYNFIDLLCDSIGVRGDGFFTSRPQIIKVTEEVIEEWI